MACHLIERASSLSPGEPRCKPSYIQRMWNLLKILSELLLPPGGLVMLAVIGIALRRRHPKLAISCGTVAVTLLIVLSLPVVGWWLGKNQARANYSPPPWPDADAIVVLGGGRRGYAVEYDADETAGVSTLERLRYAVYVARKLNKPILVAGGKPLGGTRSEGEIMQDILTNEYKLPARWVETESNDTAQNAKLSSEILRREYVKRIYLVTHADHMARAQANFETMGLEVVPIATGFVPKAALSIDYFLPSFNGMAASRWQIYNIVTRLRG